MSTRPRHRLGTVYLLHFSRPYYHARHYLGFTTRPDERLKEHLGGYGSPLVQAVVTAQIEVFVARTWAHVTQQFERRGHNRKASRRWCPICRGPSAYRVQRPRPHEMGL